jgi:hypothetical protein
MTGEFGGWAPIALFIHNRPEHLRRTILSLQACPGYAESALYVYADGPRTSADVPAVQATRQVARELLGARATFVERDHNQGLASSIIAGTTEVCDRHGRVVVIEDDLRLAPQFLQFLNEGLKAYEDASRVMQVAGHMFDVPSLANEHEALFLPMTTSWGWATWKRAWDHFDPSASGWRERLAGAEADRFNVGKNCDYAGMLKRQMTGGLDSWAIRWYYSVFVRDGLVLYPPRTLVVHEGTDGSGTHGRIVRRGARGVRSGSGTFTMPSHVALSPKVAEVGRAIGLASRPDFRRTIVSFVRSRLPAIAAGRGS